MLDTSDGHHQYYQAVWVLYCIGLVTIGWTCFALLFPHHFLFICIRAWRAVMPSHMRWPTSRILDPLSDMHIAAIKFLLLLCWALCGSSKHILAMPNRFPAIPSIFLLFWAVLQLCWALFFSANHFSSVLNTSLLCRALFGYAQHFPAIPSIFLLYWAVYPLCYAFFFYAGHLSALPSIFLLCWVFYCSAKNFFSILAVHSIAEKYTAAQKTLSIEENRLEEPKSAPQSWKMLGIAEKKLGIAEKCLEEPKSAQQRRNAARQRSNVHVSEVLYLWATVVSQPSTVRLLHSTQNYWSLKWNCQSY